ncbi:MAG: DNA mismatch repair protein MutS [Gammaproteobacteria bacterium]|nr:DNA mismatch repair protein MutS [Gammaproteobacteria bacterium]
MTKDKSADEPDFAALMTGVKRQHNDRVNTYQQHATRKTPIRPQPESTAADFAKISFEQQSQIADSYFDHGIQRKLQRKIRQGVLPIDAILDLHGYRQKQAYTELTRFFQQSSIKTVIVIHGKGNRSSNEAVLKPLVHHWLSQQNFVLAWCPAQPRDGGSGASYVYLR